MANKPGTPKPGTKRKTSRKSNPAPDGFSMNIAHGGEATSAYNLLADRVQDAVDELNAALLAAHERTDMRVEIWTDRESPRTFLHRVYRLTHTTLRFTVKTVTPDKSGRPAWDGEYRPVAKPPRDEAAN